MPDYVSISYRGATYALGQGPQFYGIWYATAPLGQPLEHWPLTPDGWTAAWSRFASVEVPGTITQVTVAPVAPMTGPAGPVAGPGGPLPGPQWAGGLVSSAARPEADPASAIRNGRIGAAVTGAGVVLGIIGLFPAYVGGASIGSQSFNLVPHLIYLAVWALSAGLILAGGVRARAGALLGLGTSAVTLGLFVADAGTAASGGPTATGAGLFLTILGWLGCTAGLVVAAAAGRAVRSRPWAAGGFRARLASRPGHDIVPLVTLVLAAIGAAIAFAPSWDRFVLHTASGMTQVVTAGNAFANPGPVIFGDVLAMIAIVAVVIVAALWRPLRLGAALALGVAVPLVAQGISAIIQISEPTSPQQFGVSQSQAAQLGLTIHSGLTAIFWVYCAFLGTLILLCVWMLVVHEPAEGSLLLPGTTAPVWGEPASAGPVGVPATVPAAAGSAGSAGADAGAADGPEGDGVAADEPDDDGPDARGSVPGVAPAGNQPSTPY